MTDRQKTGKSSKRKGKEGELDLAHILRDVYGYEVRRGYTFQHESDVIGLPGIHIECKNQKSPSVYTAYEQAVEESEKRKDGIPVVMSHKTNDGNAKKASGWKVFLSLEDFMDMYGAWRD